MIHLSEADVEKLLDMPTTVSVVEEAFRRLAANEAENSPRVRVRAPGIVLHSMCAAAGYLGYVGWKQYTTTSQGAKFVVGLHRQEDGELVAWIEANRLGQMRTGAVTGIAVKHLARADADTVGLFGSGWQAESQLMAIAAVRSLRAAFIYSRDANRRRQFADRMSKQLGISVEAVDEPRRAVDQIPIVVTATTSKSPVFDGQWLTDGALVCAIGSNWPHKAETDAVTIQRAQAVVCDSVECCRREAGELISAADQQVFAWSQAYELASVVAGTAHPRRADESILFFKSVGMAIEDVAVAAKILELSPSSRLDRNR